MEIAFIGAGRLATHLAQALYRSGHHIVQVYSRTMASASALATLVEAEATDDVTALTAQADVYIIAISDKAIEPLLPQLAKGREERTFIHTAGSMPLSVFSGHVQHGGVLYPMQTFSKERPIDFSRVPIFIEATDEATLQLIRQLAESVSQRVEELSSERRRYLHLAAVFACNFANHCYDLAAQVLQSQGLPFDLLLPLIDETAKKVETMHPHYAQTGPAVRYDQNVIEAQSQLLCDMPLTQRIYQLMSQSIHDGMNRKRDNDNDITK